MATFGFFFPVVAGQHGQAEALEALKGQSLGDWTCGLVSAAGDAAEAERVASAAGDTRISAATGLGPTIAAILNKGTADGAAFVAVLPAGVVLAKNALARIAEEFGKRPNASCLYSSYSEKKPDGTTTHVTIYPHEGAPHERFDFGYLKVYRTAHLKEIGGFRNDLVHAAEYDADLKLCDKHTLEVVDEDLYAALLPPETGGAAPSGLYSPGKGKYGGFSYVFYPEDLEKEITGVFEEMLKRRGAWIDHDSVPVPYPERPYRVKASVVIPILNRERFIGNAIQKVIDGTFQDFEVIVIDSGSTDRTPEVVREFTQKDPRIKLILQKGPSISYALNTGIRMAAGKYICQLDSDDEYAPKTLEKMVGHFESHPKCGLAISYYELMEEDGSKVEGVAPVTHSGYTRNQILRRDGAGALRVFPKVVLEEMGYYDEANFGNFGEDYDMVLKVGEKYDVDRVHAVLYRYRRHPDNTDVTRDPPMRVQNKNNARLNALRRRMAINKKLGKA